MDYIVGISGGGLLGAGIGYALAAKGFFVIGTGTATLAATYLAGKGIAISASSIATGATITLAAGGGMLVGVFIVYGIYKWYYKNSTCNTQTDISSSEIKVDGTKNIVQAGNNNNVTNYEINAVLSVDDIYKGIKEAEKYKKDPEQKKIDKENMKNTLYALIKYYEEEENKSKQNNPSIEIKEEEKSEHNK